MNVRGEKNVAMLPSVMPPEPSSSTCGWRDLIEAAALAMPAASKLSSMITSAPAYIKHLADETRAR